MEYDLETTESIIKANYRTSDIAQYIEARDTIVNVPNEISQFARTPPRPHVTLQDIAALEDDRRLQHKYHDSASESLRSARKAYHEANHRIQLSTGAFLCLHPVVCFTYRRTTLAAECYVCFKITECQMRIAMAYKLRRDFEALKGLPPWGVGRLPAAQS
jgi:hypothetical protein